ncbi:unnamed protein product [Mytilus coruscus]|uniref:Uncharacterized protein n=1 Tax=Mytilus coruscus TaxID=42192 RepID=A0A6J8EYQ5_MYTCO|nr:unnamed protein product [Mytilus coruscus]
MSSFYSLDKTETNKADIYHNITTMIIDYYELAIYFRDLANEDDTYKPIKEDIYSSDSISDAESIQNIKLIRKQRKKNYRNKDWKRKGNTLKHIQSKKRKIVAVVKNKKNRSGTWTLQDKQPITSNSQSPRASSVIKRRRKIEENTPTTENMSSSVSKRGSVITLRKRANYKSPVKKQLSRKMKSNPQAWKKTKKP